MKFDLVFEGGGAKGMVFVGALSEFEQRGHTFGRLMGTSAGAIVAALLAAGYDSAEMGEALSEKIGGRPRFATFLGVPESFDDEVVQGSATREWLRNADNPLLPKGTEERVNEWIVDTLLSSVLFRHIFSFVERGGWYAADAFLDWLRERLDKGTFQGRRRQFSPMSLKAFFEATGTDLTLLAADVSDGRLLVLNHRTAPDCPLVWAVRMSMSVPLLWQEVIWRPEWGPYRGRRISGNAIVDGGLLSNFPIELFVTEAAMWTDVMGPKQSASLIGLLIDESLPVPGAAPAQVEDSDATAGLRTVKRLKALADTLMQARDKGVITAYKQFVVRLPAKGYGTTEFDMTETRRRGLVDAGQRAMKAYFDQLGGEAPSTSPGFETAGFFEEADAVAARILEEPLAMQASPPLGVNKVHTQLVLQQALADPQFDALSIHLEDPITGDPEAEARRALGAALHEVLGATADYWTLRAVHKSLPGAYDLLPPEGFEIAISQAFDLQYALAAQPGVRAAEALFETNLDNVPESPETPPGVGELESLAEEWFAELAPGEQDPLWSLSQIGAPAVWAQTEGEGVLIGHPDSGYIPHPELQDSRIRHDKERDFYDGDANAQNAQERGGNHGLSTASVILSGRDHQGEDRFVAGVAPKAQIVPMRITRKGPPVFLFQSGPRRVRDAVYYAIDSGCDIISMSLGGVGESGLHLAIQEAVKQNLIVLAAAGNGVPFVVWPARYPETIAVAACTEARERWPDSSRGSTVDITAPGHNVWRAYIDEDGRQAARPSSGTSYATAVTAGVAALWLAFHGRRRLLEKYQGTGIKLNDVFRKLLTDTADDPPTGHDNQFGAGIINVRKLLVAPLPEAESFEAGPLESLAGAETAAAQSTAVGAVIAVFDNVPEDQVQERLATVTGVPAGELDAALAGVEEELLFHLVTNPQLRRAIISEAPESGAAPDEAAETLAPGAAPGLADLPELSGELRGRLAKER